MLGAAYLIWIGVKALVGAFRVGVEKLPDSLQEKTKPFLIKTAFLEGFLTNALNPKVSMFYLAAFPQFISVNGDAFDVYALVTLHALTNFFWFSAMILAFSHFKTTKASIQFKKWIKLLTGVVFVGFGSKMALMERD